jgi:hypothetical protein
MTEEIDMKTLELILSYRLKETDKELNCVLSIELVR